MPHQCFSIVIYGLLTYTDGLRVRSRAKKEHAGDHVCTYRGL